MAKARGFCIKMGDVGIEIGMLPTYRYRVVVPHSGYAIPLSSWYPTFAEVRSFVEGMIAGMEISSLGLDLIRTEANLCYRDALFEAAEHMRNFNLEGHLHQIITH